MRHGQKLQPLHAVIRAALKADGSAGKKRGKKVRRTK
jgi:hypothetical protein